LPAPPAGKASKFGALKGRLVAGLTGRS
jgi:hypothetical protein